MAIAKNMAVMVVVVVMAALCGFSHGSNSYIVGDSAGWTAATASDYKKWASNKDFYVGDTLEFNYNPQQHNLLEVTKEDFESCKVGTAIATYNSGKDVVTLATPKHHYFICSYHCAAGMKLKVKANKLKRGTKPSPPQGGQMAPPPPSSKNGTTDAPPVVGGNPPKTGNAPYVNWYSGAFVTSTLLWLSLLVFGV